MHKPQDCLAPLADDWEWQQQGICRSVDSSEFFHPDGERGLARAQRTKRAKSLCGRCPVIRECREHALAAGEPYGIWGGMSERELAVALQVRARRTPVDIAMTEANGAA